MTSNSRLRTAHNCSLGTVKNSFSSKVKKGLVFSQRPQWGKRLRHGAKVNLVVNEGSRP